jgi:hypothetical protein
VESLECVKTQAHTLKRGDTDIKIARHQLIFDNLFSKFFSGDKVANFHLWTPSFEFLFPISHNRLWHDQQVVPFDFFVFSEVSEQGDGLDGLSEAHFIG